MFYGSKEVEIVYEEENNEDENNITEVLPLRLLKRSNEEQMKKLFELLYKLPDLIHWYLNEFIFPAYMRHQVIKLSESGQALGGEMLFGRRIGFSGTPSDLLPIELGKCGYEKGSDGLMMTYLTSPQIVSYEVIEEGWSVRSLLDRIARADPPYHALIDTGALITGMTNYEVAAYLLKSGLRNFEGVVFLDELDRKMILVRATGRVMKLAQCGISEKRRFAFYDQVHTTGMDIKHVLNACAVLTLGKDMTFRDYSQGAFRMRSIGIGQTIHLYIIPEIERLMARELKEANMPDFGFTGTKKVLVDVAAWQVINSMRSERIQFNQLCIQNVSNLWRKNAFKSLLQYHKEFTIVEPMKDDYLRRCLQVFREPIDFSLEAGVPVPKQFIDSINKRIEANASFLQTESERDVIQHIRGLISQSKEKEKLEKEREKEKEKEKEKMVLEQEDEEEAKMRRRREKNRRKRLLASSGYFFDAEKVQEQEQEREQQQEQEQEQEIEIEKYVDLAYSRDEEAPVSWPFVTLRAFDAAQQFYPANQFHLYKRPPLKFEEYVLVSNNYFNKQWSGARRIKNVVMVLEWLPSAHTLAPLSGVGSGYRTPKGASSPTSSLPASLTEKQEAALRKAFQLFDQDNSGDLNVVEMQQLIRSAIDFIDQPKEADVEAIMREFKGAEGGLGYEQVKAFLQSGKFREEQKGRYFVALSLAEAETIRRIMHIRLERDLIDGTDMALALRCVPAENMPIDVSHRFVGSPAYQAEVAFQSLRFLNCDMFYKEPQLAILLRSLQHSTMRERAIFFERVIGCRRRMARKWEETPLAKLFTLADEYHLLKQRAQSVRIREAIKAKGMPLYDAFRLFDTTRSGFISPPELYGALEWLGIDVTPEDILDFMRTADKNGDGNIDYREFLDMVRDPDAKMWELDEDTESGEGAGAGLGLDGIPRSASKSNLQQLLQFQGTIKPKGEKELEQLKEKQQAEQKLLEEEELKREEDFERQIRREIAAEEELKDLMQEGGANPKLLGDGCIRFDFTTGRRPRDVTSRGDMAYKTEYERQYLRVYKLGMLFLPIPFSPDPSTKWKKLNQYTITLEMMLDQLPPHRMAFIQTALYNEKLADVYINSDGRIGCHDSFPPPSATSSSSTGSTSAAAASTSSSTSATSASASASAASTWAPSSVSTSTIGSSSGGDVAKLVAGKWHVVSIAVDSTAGMLNAFIDGRPAGTFLSQELAMIDGRYGVYKQVCLFGSKDQAETVGANVRMVWFETRPFDLADATNFYDSIQLENSWECFACTYRNPASAVECSVCGQFRLGATGQSVTSWACSSCTYVNERGDTCSICGAPKPPQ